MTQPSTAERLSHLSQQWKHAKEQEGSWNARRISIESEIYEIVREDLPEKGTHTTEAGIKIATGFSEDWDQELLTAAYERWQAPVAFPFKGVWKADGKAVAYLRESAPDLYRLIQPALTIKPKKPSFSLPAEK